MTALEVVGAIAGPASLALLGAVVYLAIRLQRDGRATLGAVTAAGLRELEAERARHLAATERDAARADLAQVRQALVEAKAAAAVAARDRAALNAEVLRLLEELDACSGPVAVRNRLARFLSPRVPSGG